MPSLLDHSVLCNMNTKSFYVKNLTLVTTLEEVNDIVEASDHVLSVVVLPPEAEMRRVIMKLQNVDADGLIRDGCKLHNLIYTQMQCTFYERNDDMMNIGEMSPHVV